VDEVLGRLSEQDLSEEAFRQPQPRFLSACRHLPQTVAEATMVDADLAAALASIEDELAWEQTSGYSDAALGEGFMANYCHCQIVGPNGFFPGNDFLLGFLVLGPNLHYKDHYHPAPELYWPLTGPSEWKRGAGGYESRQAGETIWHRPFIVHATATLETPLLALWCWTGETATPTKLCGS
jgi:hypothetical protein